MESQKPRSGHLTAQQLDIGAQHGPSKPAALQQQGTLSREEFEQQKARLLSQ